MPNEDAAVLIPRSIRGMIPLLSCLHVTISWILLFWGIPSLSQITVRPRKILCDWTRAGIVLYFACCSFLHIICGLLQCDVVIHDKSFYTQSILNELDEKTSGWTTLDSKSESISKRRSLSDNSVFCYGLIVDSTVVVSQAERLAWRQITNEWTRLLLNVGQAVLYFVISFVLISSWRNLHATGRMLLDVEKELHEKV
jgi:hypothetical protein